MDEDINDFAVSKITRYELGYITHSLHLDKTQTNSPET